MSTSLLVHFPTPDTVHILILHIKKKEYEEDYFFSKPT